MLLLFFPQLNSDMAIKLIKMQWNSMLLAAQLKHILQENLISVSSKGSFGKCYD